MNYAELSFHLLPEIVLLVTAFAVIALGCTDATRRSQQPRGTFSAIALAGLILALLALIGGPQEARLLNGMIVVEPAPTGSFDSRTAIRIFQRKTLNFQIFARKCFFARPSEAKRKSRGPGPEVFE